jgi:hypothetical protein
LIYSKMKPNLVGHPQFGAALVNLESAGRFRRDLQFSEHYYSATNCA